MGLLALTLAFWGTGLLAQMLNSATQADSYVIAGTVVNSLTGAPIEDARVALVETHGRKNIQTITTTESGRFEFRNLPAGKYSLQGSRQGYTSAGYDQHEAFASAIVTGPDSGTGALLLKLSPAALISGHVRDEFGEPVRQARVALFIEDHSEGWGRIKRLITAVTDDSGYFDFSNLASGTYFVAVTARPWYAVHQPPVILRHGPEPDQTSNSTNLDVAYPTTYYGNATRSDSASPIQLKPGDRASADVQLRAVPALHLLIRYEDDSRANAMQPIFLRHVFDSVEFVNPGGIFPSAPSVMESVGLPPGEYTVRLHASANDTGQLAEVNLERDGQEVDARKAELLAPLKITLEFPAGETPPRQMIVSLEDEKRRMVVAQRPMDENHEVSFPGFRASKYNILCRSAQGTFAVTRIAGPALDTAGQTISLESGVPLEVKATVTKADVDLEGAVQKAGKPRAGVMVILIPKDFEGHLNYLRRDQSDLDGSFLLRGVLPGVYTVVAIEDAWDTAWQQPATLARYAKHGRELTIPPSARGSVHLPEAVEVQPK